MNENIKNAIEKYQCSGCVVGMDISCFSPLGTGVGCGKHLAGTIILPYIGKIFLGMPKGFCRLGVSEDIKLRIFEKYDNNYNVFNVPTWKHLTKDGHTMIRGMSPRTNWTFVDVFLENCLSKIECIEISQDELDSMD